MTRLFIPGPVEVDPAILEAMARPPVGHRSEAFHELMRTVRGRAAEVLETDRTIYFATASATGVWELAIRSGVREKALFLTNGAFSERWYRSCLRNGREADALEAEWGEVHRPEHVREALEGGEYDALCLAHSETSTGALQPLPAIAEVCADFPDVRLLVDAVSSWTTLPVDVDGGDLDLCVASVQKAFGLPPGLSIFTASRALHERALSIDDTARGYYFDLLVFDRYGAKDETPTTPSISHLRALDLQLRRMAEEGMEARFARHREMAETCRTWARERGFSLFPPAEHAAVGLTCIRNDRDIDVEALNGWLQEEHDAMISNGYGKLAEETFRIAHMGDRRPEDLAWLLGRIDEWLG